MHSKSKAFENLFCPVVKPFKEAAELVRELYHLKRNPEHLNPALERLAKDKNLAEQEINEIKNSLKNPYTKYIFPHLSFHAATMFWPLPPFGFIMRDTWTLSCRAYYEIKKLIFRQKIKSGISGLENKLKDAEIKAKIHSMPVVLTSSIFFLPVCWFGYLHPLKKVNENLAYLLLDQRIYSKKGITLDEYLQQVIKPKRWLIEKLVVPKKFRQKKHIEVADSIKQKGLIFIVNPVANKGRTLKKLDKFREILDEYDFSYQIQIPQTKEETIALTRNLVKNGLENIAVFAGDGTIADVINGIIQNNNSSNNDNGIPDLALFNLGSGNGYATSLKIPRNFRKALEAGLNHNKKYADLIKINTPGLSEQTIYSQNLVGIGFDAKVQKYRDQDFKNHRRQLAYFLSFLKSLNSLESEKTEMQIKMNGMTIDTSAYMLLIAKGSYYSPETKIAPYACLDDGLLDITIFNNKNNLINYFLKSSHLPFISCKNRICHYKSKKLEVHAKTPILWHHDGDVMPSCQDYYFEVMPKSVKIKTSC